MHWTVEESEAGQSTACPGETEVKGGGLVPVASSVCPL